MTAPNPTHAATRSLVDQRAQLQGWLDRLESHGAEMPDHVVQRVREDYLQRLQRVTEELGQHLGVLRQDLERTSEELAAADARHTAATDSLAELRLRHLIGELTDEEWSRRRPELERGQADADAARESLAAEADRLRELVASVEAAAPAGRDEEDDPGRAQRDEMGYVDSTLSGEPDARADDLDATVDGIFAGWSVEPGDDGEELPWLEVEAAADPGASAPGPEAEPFDELEFLRDVASTEPGTGKDAETEPVADAGDDIAFLEELDRAIAASSPPAAREGGEPAAEAADAQPAKATLVCKECGATNDTRAWYCEICGMELTN
jgi:ribosomal protein L40E